MRSFFFKVRVALALLLTPAGFLLPDEGMWPFDNVPRELLLKKYGFAPEEKWLNHVRLSCVRFMDGGSGSFVSPFGLVATNHHVAVGQVQKLSSPGRDLVQQGFYARTLAEELPCPDLELNVLVSMENVTQRVLAALKPGMSESEAMRARKAAIARIERESLRKTGLRSDVVSLYRGGEYWLYRYRKYTDVRLVMVPERGAAYFGGDWDNFTYPRYDLDVAFLRVWENGKPLRTENFLKWNPQGVHEGQLVFVAGHPGSTKRLNTMVQLSYLREKVYPSRLRQIERTLKALEAYARKGPEQRRRALVYIFGNRNAQKALSGEYAGLRDPELMAKRARAEEELRKRVQADPELRKKFGWAWERIAETYRKYGERAFLQRFQSLGPSRLGMLAVNIVKYVEEVLKPDSERLDGFHEAELPQLRFRLYSPAPVYRDLEAVLLEIALRSALENLPREDPFARVVASLGEPREAARRLAQTTKLVDPAFRKRLVEGGIEEVKKSCDPLIKLARRLVPIMRRNEKWREKVWEGAITPASEAIARARFAVYGKSVYPDATFSLRLAFGPVAGYPMNGTKAPYKTTLYGLYDRALSFDRKEPFDLPERFWIRRGRLDLSTPVNFVSECDITGGNSGSPVIDTEARLVGLIFDGNIESLPNEFWYDGSRARAVAVHSAYVIEALRKLYDAEGLVEELLRQKPPAGGKKP